jgi:hypothetical protein
MRRSASVLVLVLLAAALVASAAGATRLKRHTVPGQGVFLSAPPTWVVIDGRLPASVVDRIADENPQLAPFIANLKSSPAKFIAIDPDVRLGFATNVNVVVTPVPAYLTFATYRAALTNELRVLTHGQRIGQRVLKINGAKAIRVSYRLRIRLGRSFRVQTLQYAFLRRNRSVVITYSTLPRLVGRYGRTFAASAATIRFSGP